MSENRLKQEVSNGVSKPIKNIDRTVDPGVFTRNTYRDKEEITLPNIAYKLGKANINDWNEFTRRFNIIVFGIGHGVVMAVIYFIFYLNIIPFMSIEDQSLKLTTFFLISLPLGIYLSDLMQAISVTIISIPVWMLMVTLFISFPAFSGLVTGSGIGSIVTNFPQVLEFLFFLPFSLLFGLILPSVYGEMKK
ncbi:MAG: hypothetical protein HeimC3_07640 [Candidatus Heimdallarchaeota archaeon LC_3]|nr:MAG: hypothetical protein HeimC3_07640 [Candidatus Heimdallarchaeota archaeon LC_3]